MTAGLIGEEGNLAGTNIPLVEEEEWILGRDPDVCFQVLEDPMVSRKHVLIRLVDGKYTIENLSATNPAQVNGEELIDPVTLQEDDMLQIGNTIFRFTRDLETITYPEDLVEHSDETEEAMIAKTERAPSPLDSIEDSPFDIGQLSFSKDIDTRWMIKVVSGPNTGAEFGLKEGESYTLGKDPATADILFQDLSVSRQHAKIHLNREAIVSIEDLGSRNGVLVNGSLCEGTLELKSQDVVALGTTAFLLIDRELMRETIYSPPAMTTYSDKELSDKEKQEQEAKANALEEEIKTRRNWKETFIPTRHIVLGALLILVIFAGIVGTLSLFQTRPVTLATIDEDAEIKKVVKDFPAVQFSFATKSGTLFLTGHVLTDVEYQELVYLLKSKSFIKQIEDNVIIDEYVWKNMNALLYKNPQWRAVLITGNAPGKFVLKGYLETLDQLADLNEFVSREFPYLDKLKNDVVVEKNLETEVQTLLTEQGFANVTFQLSNGELVFAGRAEQADTKTFNALLSHIEELPGVRQVKNFIIFTSHSSARIDITQRFQVTGTSKYGNENQFVLINGKILTTGDQLDGMIITAINPHSVFLEKEGMKYKIDFNLQ